MPKALRSKDYISLAAMAVSRDACLIREMPQPIQSNREVIAAGLARSWKAYEWLPPDLQLDPAVVAMRVAAQAKATDFLEATTASLKNGTVFPPTTRW